MLSSFTPVSYSKWETANWIFPASKEAVVISSKGNTHYYLMRERTPSFNETLIKVLLCATIILPLICYLAERMRFFEENLQPADLPSLLKGSMDEAAIPKNFQQRECIAYRPCSFESEGYILSPSTSYALMLKGKEVIAAHRLDRLKIPDAVKKSDWVVEEKINYINHPGRQQELFRKHGKSLHKAIDQLVTFIFHTGVNNRSFTNTVIVEGTNPPQIALLDLKKISCEISGVYGCYWPNENHFFQRGVIGCLGTMEQIAWVNAKMFKLRSCEAEFHQKRVERRKLQLRSWELLSKMHPNKSLADSLYLLDSPNEALERWEARRIWFNRKGIAAGRTTFFTPYDLPNIHQFLDMEKKATAFNPNNGRYAPWHITMAEVVLALCNEIKTILERQKKKPTLIEQRTLTLRTYERDVTRFHMLGHPEKDYWVPQVLEALKKADLIFWYHSIPGSGESYIEA